MRKTALKKKLVPIAAMTALASVLITTGCAPTAVDLSTAEKVMQSVKVDLASDGSVTSIDSSAIYLSHAAEITNTEMATHDPAQVLHDLPVRFTTRYHTAEQSGADLQDLSGYTGRVEIEVSLENLTVSPTQLTYDVAGESRTAPALVGTPLSIAGSTILPNVDPSQIIFEDDQGGTTGVVSTTEEGGSVVQWATLLAPPQTEATARFTLVAHVNDFQVPEFDVAVQAGLRTDLSFEQVVSSTVDETSDTELGLQQRAISLVTEVNDVLNRAGATITEVRTNLEDTSGNLGGRAAKNLEESTGMLTTEMQELGQQLAELDAQFTESVTDTQSVMTDQLSSLVSSMNTALGDTSGAMPELIQGEGCNATVAPGTEGNTVYSMFLRLSGQLNGYAESADSCKDEILAGIEKTLGPTEPDQASCTTDVEPSITCALYTSKQTVRSSTLEMVSQGQAMVTELDGSQVTTAITKNGQLQQKVTDLGQAVQDIDAVENPESVQQLVRALQQLIDETDRELASMTEISATATEAIAELETVEGQYTDLAESICTLAAERELGLEHAEDLLVQISSDACLDGLEEIFLEEERLAELERAEEELEMEEETPSENAATPTPTSTPTQSPTPSPEPSASTEVETEEQEIPVVVDPASLEQSRRDQLVLWESILQQTDPESPDSAIAELDELLRVFSEELTNIIGSTDDLELQLTELAPQIEDIQVSALEVEEQLEAVQEQQNQLEEKIVDHLQVTADEVTDLVDSTVEQQIYRVSSRVNRGNTEIADSYAQTVGQLKATSSTMLDEATENIQSQQGELETTHSGIADSMSSQTQQALQHLNATTSNATADVDGAEALLADSLNRVILDLGDPAVEGSGILGAMAASAAKSGSADYQLALASQQAAGFANVRAEDIASIMLRQAQFEAAVDSVEEFPSFNLDLPEGATSQTIYSFHLSGSNE